MMLLNEPSGGANAAQRSQLDLANDGTASGDVLDRTFWHILAGDYHNALQIRPAGSVEIDTSATDQLKGLDSCPTAAFDAALRCFFEPWALWQSAPSQGGGSLSGEQQAGALSPSASWMDFLHSVTSAEDRKAALVTSAPIAHRQFERLFTRFITERRDIVDKALDDGPEALDQEIIHWIAETCVCGADVNDFFSALVDPVGRALTVYLNLRTRERHWRR